MLKIQNRVLKEVSYDLKDSAKLASVFGIGNGYFGLRGSLEELGEVFIQGLYIRGVFDQIVEIPLTFCDNLYMKRYYFDDQKLKEFELEDSCINICDPIHCRFYVNGKLFLPWEGEVKKWNRFINFKTGGLVRTVTWDDGNGNLTKFSFERYCSFANNHLIIQEASVEKVNHDLPVKIEMGIDTLVKTNGQHKSKITKVENRQNEVHLEFHCGPKYNHCVSLDSHNEVEGVRVLKEKEKDGVYFTDYTVKGKKATVRKVVSIYANVDPVDNYVKASKEDSKISYEQALDDHLRAYSDAFNRIDIKLEGNEEAEKADALIRYANYQTLIGFDRYDSVHSLSAKNLTAEKYNQFVWWDAEIFQLPIVVASFPEAAKHCLEYRYRCLEEGKKIAKKDGYDGCKFAFCSSVKGDENVWIYARHPFLQIHIASDVAYGCYNYYRQTLDKEFMLSKGMEMMVEVCKYFASRVTKKGNELHLLNVTGTDEHHPYVNNDAYTNFEVAFIAKETLKLAKKLGYEIKDEVKKSITNLTKNIYLPKPNEKGVLPQFDGYFDLKTYLPLDGNGNGTGFQMKASGLYHLSQIIKQPDVLNLYTYLDVDMPQDIYKANYLYYTKMCEASSSLTYPVHTICAIDFHNNQRFMEDLFNSIEIDIKDIHHCAYQGVHAGCLAGGWYSIYRGVLGIRARLDGIYLDPKFDSPFSNVEMNFMFQGESYHIALDRKKVVVTSNSKKPVNIFFKGETVKHVGVTTLNK